MAKVKKQKINFIVTDLDDTIWDWLTMWYESFNPYLNRISKEFNIDINELKADFKRIHQKYNSSESSFVYEDLTCLTQDQKREFRNDNPEKKSIIHEYNSLKKNNLNFCKDVLKTLKKLKEKGVMIIGFTESNAFYTKYRIKHLELDGLIDYVYAPIDYGVPSSVYKIYPEDYWEPEITEFRYLSKNTRKPAPDILEVILKDFNASKENTIYIGDKLDKDVYMANEAAVTSVYAKYGHNIDTDKYQLLRDVTHWSQEDVEREKEYKKSNAQNSIAKYELKKSFSEIMTLFDYYEFDTVVKNKNFQNILPIWEKTIEVQQHFNDIELRIRNFALTAFTFILGAIGYLELGSNKITITVFGLSIPYSAIVAIIGCFILFAFFYMDKYWYHRLLVGAVEQGDFIERRWKKNIPEIELTRTIGNSSPHKFLWKWSVHSNHKYRIFYGLLFFVLIAIVVILLFF